MTSTNEIQWFWFGYDVTGTVENHISFLSLLQDELRFMKLAQ